ncbi:MAG: diguanylate cyclase domain-containing protein [Holosporales bacterium]
MEERKPTARADHYEHNIFQHWLQLIEEKRHTIFNQIIALTQNPELTSVAAICKDIEEIINSVERLGSLIQFLNQERTDTADAADKWSHYRHDLRALIGAIRGYSELIIEEHEKNLSQKVKITLNSVIEDANTILGYADKIRLIQPIEFDEKEETSGYSPYPSRILIVDDSAAKRDLLARRLVSAGHSVLLAESGVEGLTILSRENVDLVLLDLVMPGLNGLEVLKRIKSNEHTRDLPVVVISSQSELESVVACIRVGADDYLPMPVSPVLLHARINACLNKKHLLYRERAQSAELFALQQHLKTAIESMEDGFCIFDADDCLTVWNQRFQGLYPALESLEAGIDYKTLIQSLIAHQDIRLDRRGHPEAAAPSALDDWAKKELNHHQQRHSPRQWLLTCGRWIEINEHALPDGGTVIIHKDITERKTQEQHMNFLANHDGLTGLANRNSFTSQLSEACKRFSEHQEGFALLFLDLDGFKGVNDTFGHDVGDQLLKYVAKQLRQSVRDSDSVARLGGDEFVVLIHGMHTTEDITPIAERIVAALHDQISFQGQTLQYGCSIGIALCPDHGTTPEALMLIADETMYKAKKAGKGRFIFAQSPA